MTTGLDGRVALVTGGLSGIGAAVAARLAQDGATVIAADLAATATVIAPAAIAPAPIAPGSIAPLHVDVADAASVAAMEAAIRDRFGRLDCLVHAAGIGRDSPFLATSVEMFDQVIAVNLRGTFLIGQAAARLMRASGGGAIVNIASISGLVGSLGRAAYGASKGGVVTLSLVMAVELSADGIRVNVIAPGPIDTPMVERHHTAEVRAQFAARIPMRRYGTPAEIAATAAFLCSDEASYITGQVLAVDGGFMGAGLIPRRGEAEAG